MASPLLWIYEDFDLCGILPAYTQLRWNRRWNDLSTFELRLPFTVENYDLLTKKRVIYRRDLDEGMEIVNRNVYTDTKGERQIIIRGDGVERILDSRVHLLTTEAQVQTVVESVLNQTIINPTDPDRQIDNFILGNMVVQANTVKVDVQNRSSVLGIITQIVQPYLIGFKVAYDIEGRQYVFSLRQQLTDNNVIFDKLYKNIVEQDIFELGGGYRNVVYVDSTPVGAGVGIERRETAVARIREEQPAVTGARVLEQQKEVLSIDARIDACSPQYEYLKDWDLGDIVTFRDKDTGIELKRNVLEIKEFYETGRKKLDVVFGDYTPRGSQAAPGGGSVTPGSAGGGPGKSGEDGKNAFVHIRWGTSAAPATLLTSPDEYIGITSTDNPIAPTNYTGYSWYKYKGDKGDDGSSDLPTGGTADQYFAGDKTLATFATGVLSAVLTGLSVATNAAITAADSVLAALGKLQAQITSAATAAANAQSNLNSHTADTVVHVTSLDKTAWNAKEPGITAGTTSQYWRGDKTWQTLNSSAVGLDNVNNTTDANKPISTATQAALNAKENTITAGTTAQYFRGDKSWQDLATAARAVVLTGLSTATNAAITATDTILAALGKLQAQITTKANTADVVLLTGNQTINGTKTFAVSPPVPAKSTAAANAAAVLATEAQVYLKANLASPTFTGTPAGPTAAAGTNTTQFATTAFVQTALLGNKGNVNYGTCATVAGTAAKVVSDITGFTRTTNVGVRVKFSATNTSAAPTLNVMSTGAAAIQCRGVAYTDLQAGVIYDFVWTGSVWELAGYMTPKSQNANGAIFSRNLGGRYSASASQAGCIKITITPDINAATMIAFKVIGYNYSTAKVWECLIGGYTGGAATSGSWASTYAVSPTQNMPNDTIRFWKDTSAGQMGVLIGVETGTWSYPAIFVTEALVGYGATVPTNWAVDFVTSISTLTLSGGTLNANSTTGGSNPNPSFDSLYNKATLQGTTSFTSTVITETIIIKSSGLTLATRTTTFTTTTATVVTAFQARTFTLDGMNVTTVSKTDTSTVTLSSMAWTAS